MGLRSSANDSVREVPDSALRSRKSSPSWAHQPGSRPARRGRIAAGREESGIIAVLGMGVRAQSPASKCNVSNRMSESAWWMTACLTKANGDDTRFIRHIGLDA